MNGTAHLIPRTCVGCNKEFLPKPQGYNAKYCSKNCKKSCKIKRKYPYSYEARKRSYDKTKLDEEKYAKHLFSARKSADKVRSWLYTYKTESGCIDCGYKDHPSALQLDHEGEKKEDISACRSSIERLKKEILEGQCVVRCANCHSVKTWAQKNGFEYIPKKSYEEYRQENTKE